MWRFRNMPPRRHAPPLRPLVAGFFQSPDDDLQLSSRHVLMQGGFTAFLQVHFHKFVRSLRAVAPQFFGRFVDLRLFLRRKPQVAMLVERLGAVNLVWSGSEAFEPPAGVIEGRPAERILVPRIRTEFEQHIHHVRLDARAPHGSDQRRHSKAVTAVRVNARFQALAHNFGAAHADGVKHTFALHGLAAHAHRIPRRPPLCATAREQCATDHRSDTSQKPSAFYNQLWRAAQGADMSTATLNENQTAVAAEITRTATPPRIAYQHLAGEALRAMGAVERYLQTCSLDAKLLHLVRLRASQINGCAYCIDMHWKDLIASGESAQRMYGLDAWRESPYYSARERAALEWTEAVTRVADTHVNDAVFEAVRPHFSDQELVDLTWTLAAINAWNRLAISTRAEPGKYQSPAARHKTEASGSQL